MVREQQNKYLVVKAKGGMGNCMLCAVTGLLYGQLTGKATVVDWRGTGYTNDGSNTFARFFTCAQAQPESILPSDATVNPVVWQDYLDRSMSQMIHQFDPDKHRSIRIHRKYSIDVRRLDYPDDIVIFWYYTGRINAMKRHIPGRLPDFEGLDTRAIIRKVLTEQMILNEDIRRRIEEFKKQHWADRVVGVHIRYSDRKTNLAHYRKALERILHCYPEATIFLATDNQEISRQYQQRYKKVIATPKWYPEEGATMHQNQTCPDKIENGMEALVDMYLLAECDGLIYSGYSTFSLISRILSLAPSANITDIDKFNLKLKAKQCIREWTA